MNYKNMFKGDYIAAVEMGDKQPTLTIANVKITKLPADDGREKDRGIVMFREIDRGWVINRTNAECLAAMWGPETDAWIGKRVTLYSTLVRFGGKTEPGIRVLGSPDLLQALTVTVKLPRKKPALMKLIPTTKGSAAETPRDEEGGADGTGD